MPFMVRRSGSKSSNRTQSAARSAASSNKHGKTLLEDRISEVSSSMFSVIQNECKAVENHSDSVLSGLEALWRQSQLCDVTITVGGERFRAHRSALASCSEHFLNLFLQKTRHDATHTCETDVNLDGKLSAASMRTILDCMYTGNLGISEANVRDLLEASTYLKFYNIMGACDDFLMSRLTPTNCLRMLVLACTYRMSRLQNEALKLAAENFLEVSDGFDYQQLEIDQLLMLLSRDDVKVDTELDVFHRALNWIEADKASRLKHTINVLEKIRLSLLTPSDIVDHVETVDYLHDNPECQKLIKEALHYHCLPARQSLLQTGRTQPRSTNKKMVILCLGGAPRLKRDPVGKEVMYYDPDTDCWSHLSHLPQPRHHMAAAVLGGFLYVAGGEETNDQRSPLNTAFRYDPRTNSWLQIASMNHRRESFQMAVLSGMMYAVGGRVDKEHSLSSVERYNPAVDTWEQVAPLSTPRRSVAVCSHGGRLYAVGGSGDKKISSKVERYNPLNNQWEARRALVTPRFFALLVSVGKNMYLLGGATLSSSGKVICVDKVECYHPTSDTWTQLSGMLEPRAEASCAVLHSSIYVMGGYSWDKNIRLDTVEVFDIDNNQWDFIRPIPTPYTGIAAATLTCFSFPLPSQEAEEEEEREEGEEMIPPSQSASLDSQRWGPSSLKSEMVAGAAKLPQKTNSVL